MARFGARAWGNGAVKLLAGVGACASAPPALAQSVDPGAGPAAALPVILPWAIAVVAALAAAGLWSAGRRRAARLAAARDAAEVERARLSGIVEAFPGGVLYRSEAGAWRATPGLLALLGLAAGDTLPIETVLSAVAEEDRDELRAAIAALRERGTGFDRRVRLAGSDRSVRAIGRRGAGTPAVDGIAFLDDSTAAAAEQDATAESDRLGRLLDTLPIPVWMRDAELALTYCNAAFAQTADAPAAEAVAAGVEIGGGAKALAARARDLGMPQSESQHVVVAGKRRLFNLVEVPLPDGGLAGHALDMTSLEETQSELARHIAAHADVLEALNTGIVIYGPDARVKFFNTAFQELFELDTRLLGNEPTMGEVLEAMRERRRTEEVPNFPAYKRDRVKQLMSVIGPLEELLHLPNGSTLRTLAAPHPFGGVLITYEDVTDRLALERSYNTLIEVQRESIDNLYEGIAVFGSDGRLKLSNPAFARMWGLAPEELTGEPHISDIVERTRRFFDPRKDWAALKERIIGRLSARETIRDRLERPDGSVLDHVSVPLPDGGSLLTYIDVTDSTRVERALRERNAALETADRLKSEFIANVSYELRTPLNAIIGFAEILNLQYFGTLNERQVEYSRGIVEASQRLLALINDILDIATIEAGHLQLDLASVDLRTLFGALQVLAGERARNCELGLELTCAPDVGLVVADERRLKQAIYNLISNAIKFTPPGGRITVTAMRDAEEVSITVVDTGVGIPPEDQQRVFEKFAQIGNAPRHGGAGVGMALVRSLIELHGGSVSLESQPGQGTTVTCRIPAKGPAEGG